MLHPIKMEDAGSIPAPCAIEINARKVYIHTKDLIGVRFLTSQPHWEVAQR
jgi:hypothetical protein